MERSKEGTKKEVPTAYHYIIKININEHNLALLCKRYMTKKQKTASEE